MFWKSWINRSQNNNCNFGTNNSKLIKVLEIEKSCKRAPYNHYKCFKFNVEFCKFGGFNVIFLRLRNITTKILKKFDLKFFHYDVINIFQYFSLSVLIIFTFQKTIFFSSMIFITFDLFFVPSLFFFLIITKQKKIFSY